jgi:hypothetical protein
MDRPSWARVPVADFTPCSQSEIDPKYLSSVHRTRGHGDEINFTQGLGLVHLAKKDLKYE